ncbi:MAG: HAMP domain-containing histidine kinase [Ruminococcus sp.]|nr:HAMP domain-containing histidine kinase [Ruminococcus sp.]
MKQQNKEAHKQRISLVFEVSLFVFLINTAAVLLAVGIVHILLYFDVIHSINNTLNLSCMFFFMALISAIIGFLITFFMSRIFLKSVNQLVDQLEQLAKKNFKVRIKFGKPFSNDSIFRIVEKSFNAAAEELEQTEMLRNDFVNNFSHEFKTPIDSIASFAKLLRVGNLSDEEKEDYLAVIEEESLRLSDMANHVLNLTRVENQTILINASAYNLSEQLRSNILMLSDQWTQKHLNFQIEFDEYTIVANKELLAQAWMNLISNAIKFANPNSTITVEIKKEAEQIIVAITDVGEMIPLDRIDKIWDKFYQAEESHASSGNGIGLAIVKRVVELHKGRVYAENKTDCVTFTVVLPAGGN